MANTGYRIYPNLGKVTDDINQFPLDINNNLCSVSGLPQATIPNPPSNPSYRVEDYTGCGVPTIFSFLRTAEFQKNDCTGTTVGTIVSYEKLYTSTISDADAEAIANADTTNFNTLGQAYANSHGTCKVPLPSDAVGIVVIDMYNNTNLDVCCYLDNPNIGQYQQAVYRNGFNFYPNDGTPAENCWLLASDLMGGTTNYRFEVNMARLINTYSLEPTFDIVVKGRTRDSSTTVGGAYSLKGAEVGNMIMTGSPGSYIPSTQNAINIDLINYSGKPLTGGGDNTIGVNIGAEILRFRYTVSTKTLVLL